jgi:hypothetical protein
MVFRSNRPIFGCNHHSVLPRERALSREFHWPDRRRSERRGTLEGVPSISSGMESPNALRWRFRSTSGCTFAEIKSRESFRVVPGEKAHCDARAAPAVRLSLSPTRGAPDTAEYSGSLRTRSQLASLRFDPASVACGQSLKIRRPSKHSRKSCGYATGNSSQIKLIQMEQYKTDYELPTKILRSY